MIAHRTSRLSLGAVAISLALSVSFPVISIGQTRTSSSPNSTVSSNPRAPADDPRVGLKGGLYDAGEAAFGMEKLATLPKPPGFAPGDMVGAPAPPPPTPPGEAPPPGPPPSQYGSTNSDLAFSGNHLFVGNYNGINFYDIDSPSKINCGCRWSALAARETSQCMAICSSCRQKQ